MPDEEVPNPFENLDTSNPFENLDNDKPRNSDSYVIIDQGDGIYKIAVNFEVEIKQREIKVIRNGVTLKKQLANSNEIPEEFSEILLKINPMIDRHEIRSFYLALRNSKYDGITKRELMRARGVHQNADFCSFVLNSLYDQGLVTCRKIHTHGRSKDTWLLREYS